MHQSVNDRGFAWLPLHDKAMARRRVSSGVGRAMRSMPRSWSARASRSSSSERQGADAEGALSLLQEGAVSCFASTNQRDPSLKSFVMVKPKRTA